MLGSWFDHDDGRICVLEQNMPCPLNVSKYLLTSLGMDTTPLTGRSWSASLLGVAAIVFGVATLGEGGGVLFGDGAARLAAGHYVSFVVWVNFLAGFAYVLAGAGIVLGRSWAARLGVALAAVTALTFAAFGVHVAGGGAFETRTVVALSLRTLFWTVVSWRVCAAVGCRGKSRLLAAPAPGAR